MRSCRRIGPLVLILAVVGLTPRVAAVAADDDERAVKEALERFHAALHEMFEGELGPMKDLWSHADDVTYLGPGGGIEVGWDKVLANWETQAAKNLRGGVRFEKVRIMAGRDIGVTVCQVVGENIVDGKPQKVSIRATSTFRKENGQWRMIGHHTDLLPFLQQ